MPAPRRDRPLALGEPLPDVRLQAADGSEPSLASLARGRTIVLVCVRYYG